MKKSILVLIVLLAMAFFAIIMVPPLSSVKFLTVSGNSIEPVITEKDLIVVALSKNKGVDAEYFSENAFLKGLKVGDVITYKHEIDGKEVLISHRIVEINRSGNEVTIKTKGDNLPEPDDYFVRGSQIRGTVVLIIPLLGAFLRFANSFYGVILLIFIPATIIIFMEAREIIRYKGGCKK